GASAGAGARPPWAAPAPGPEATASAVIADIVDVARTLEAKPDQRVPAAGVAEGSQGGTQVLPMDEVVTSYYLRISAQDKPGVMSQVAKICSDQGISIEALIQHEPAEGEALVPVVILTSRAREARLREAVAQIEALDTVEGEVVRIRVEPLG
ncbi:ACT domain-containing protein, partial [Microbulbifer taiwanensis]|uniref:ACT domain-containing protein n=1 Tax=Microbulbifer taiwanensis TaxID=986746 RepID=UPI0018683CD3